uniref:Immunoglobulin V-set domain-containing protein n=1 Tax=Ursus maritimus TaxID=29073 RepID=A0A452U7F2_URSMA
KVNTRPCWMLWELEESWGARVTTGSPKMGQRRVLRCDPISGHRLAYWCPQNQRQGMEFLISFQNENTANILEMCFSTEFSEDGLSALKIQPVELGDSAGYFCASSYPHQCRLPSSQCTNLPPNSRGRREGGDMLLGE